jgi:hypothetical protein
VERTGSTAGRVIVCLVSVSNPRRQQLRRLAQAASRGAVAGVALATAALAAAAGRAGLSLALVLVAGALALASRRALRLAARSRMGAESETHVRRALAPLAREGWHVRHAVDWPGGGDLDHVLRAPSGIGFVIETKTRRFTRAHVMRTAGAARRLARRRRYPRGVVPVLCVTRARSLTRFEGELLIVSLDRLVPSLRAVAVAVRPLVVASAS